jgi:hypothetical protein
MNEDWKRIINNWSSGRNYKLFKQKIKYRNMYIMNDDELIAAIEAAFEYAALDDEDKEAFDFLDHEFAAKNLKDILSSYIQTLLQWYYYQIKYERSQEYELCANIRDVIELEKEEMGRIVETYFPNEINISLLETLKKTSKEQADINYEEWEKLTSI